MLTSDSLFNGRLSVRQEAGGYRFSLDAVLLAGLAGVKRSDRVVDLGAGCGVIPLILAFRGLGKSIVGMEIQPELAALAAKNVRDNGFEDRIRVIEGDYREIASHLPAECADIALSNPPYRKPRSGRVNPHPQKAMARHEIAATIADVFKAARYLLKGGGRLALIYPSARLGRLMAEADRHGFSPKDLTVVYSSVSGPARLVFVECRKGGGEELRVAAPFYIYREDGSYTEAMRKFYED